MNDFIFFIFRSILILTSCRFIQSDVYVYDNLNVSLADFDDQAASFGPSFPDAGLQGYITTTKPINGCKPILPPPNIPNLKYKWIALIPRTQGSDSCEFVVKIRNAYYANFSAVIIYNYEDAIINMGASDRNIHIPSTFITLSSGLKLLSNYLFNHTFINDTPKYRVKIVGEQSIPATSYLIPIAVVTAFFILAIIGFVIIKGYLNRRRTYPHRLPRSALKRLKIKKFVKGDPWEVCAICLDDYVEGAKIRILPCDHAYHVKCIDPWLVDNRRQCPVCKRYVFPEHNDTDEARVSQSATRTPTEQTPLVYGNNEDSASNASDDQTERREANPSDRGARTVSFASDPSLQNIEVASSSQPTTTAVELVRDRASSSSRRYGSMGEHPTNARVANFFVGSIGGTTDNTNVSSRSIVEDVSDIEVLHDDTDVEIRPTTNRSTDNPAFVNDERSATNGNSTNL